MNVMINYSPENVAVLIDANATLTEVSFAMESVTGYFIGRGVSGFECIRSSGQQGNCILSIKPLSKAGPMEISKVGTIAYAISQGLFPEDIPASQLFQVEHDFEKSISDGQHKHGTMKKQVSLLGSKKEGKDTVSIIESFYLKPDLPLTVLSFGLADMFTGLFALDCEYIKWQGSLKKTQLYIKHNITEEALKRFLMSNHDYDINRKVSSLSRS